MADEVVEDADPAVYSGPTLVGCMVMYLFYGIALSQIGTYASKYNHGNRLYTSPAALVGAVFFLATGNLASISYTTWNRLILSTHIPVALWTPPRNSIATSVVNGTIAFLVQMFFAKKVWVLGCSLRIPRMRIPGIIIAVLATLHWISAVITSTFFGLGYRKFTNAISVMVAINMGTALVTDLAITVAMIKLLSHYKAHSAFSATKTLLNALTRHTIENGMITTVCAGVNIIVYYAREPDNTHSPFQYVIGQLYLLVLVTSLNRAISAGSAPTQTFSIGTMNHHPTSLGPATTTAVDTDPNDGLTGNRYERASLRLGDDDSTGRRSSKAAIKAYV